MRTALAHPDRVVQLAVIFQQLGPAGFCGHASRIRRLSAGHRDNNPTATTSARQPLFWPCAVLTLSNFPEPVETLDRCRLLYRLYRSHPGPQCIGTGNWITGGRELFHHSPALFVNRVNVQASPGPPPEPPPAGSTYNLDQLTSPAESQVSVSDSV